jgi:DNA-binding transcriptional ArsR family regulator
MGDSLMLFPPRKAVRLSQLRPRGSETHVADFGSGDVGRHNRAILAQREAEYAEMRTLFGSEPELAAHGGKGGPSWLPNGGKGGPETPVERRKPHGGRRSNEAIVKHAVLAYLAAHPAKVLRTRTITEALGYTGSAVSNWLNRLAVAGLVERVGRGFWKAV